MQIYCFKCKEKTDSVGMERKVVKSRNRNAWRISCLCEKCGSKKSTFIKSDSGGETQITTKEIENPPEEIVHSTSDSSDS